MGDGNILGKLAIPYMIVGSVMTVCGAIGIYEGNARLEPIKLEIASLEGQLSRQEEALATLNSEVRPYWEALRPGSIVAGKAGQSEAEQIRAYCLTTSIFPQTKLPKDYRLCEMVNETYIAAANVESTKAQLAVKLSELDYSGWAFIKTLSLGSVVIGPLLLAGGCLYWAINALSQKPRFSPI